LADRSFIVATCPLILWVNNNNSSDNTLVDSDFGGEDVFIMPEVLREAMYQLNELQNDKAGFQQSKSMDLSITDYSIEHIEE